MNDFYGIIYPNRRKELEKLLETTNITTVSGESIRDVAPYIEFTIKTEEDVMMTLVNRLIASIKNDETTQFKLVNRLRNDEKYGNMQMEWNMTKGMQTPYYKEFKLAN